MVPIYIFYLELAARFEKTTTLFFFFFFLLFSRCLRAASWPHIKIYNNKKKDMVPHKKNVPKTKRKKMSEQQSTSLLRPPTACTSATSRGRPPSRSYKRCSRTRRASRSQPCVSRGRRLLLFRCGAALFFDDKKRAALVTSDERESARWRSNREVMDCAKTPIIRSFALASNIGLAGLKRSATPSRRTQTLSLSTGRRRRRKVQTSEEKEASRRVGSSKPPGTLRARRRRHHRLGNKETTRKSQKKEAFSGSFLTFSKKEERKAQKQKREARALF